MQSSGVDRICVLGLKLSFVLTLYCPRGASGAHPLCFFRITFFAADFIFSLLGIPHQYMIAHYGENRLQISLRVLEI